MSDDGCEGVEEEPRNSLTISALPSASLVGAEVVDEDVAGVADSGATFEAAEANAANRAGSFEGPPVERKPGCLPFTWVDGVVGTNPKDFTLPVLTPCVTASEDGKGGETSSMEPKVAAEPETKGKGGRERRGWTDVP